MGGGTDRTWANGRRNGVIHKTGEFSKRKRKGMVPGPKKVVRVELLGEGRSGLSKKKTEFPPRSRQAAKKPEPSSSTRKKRKINHYKT